MRAPEECGGRVRAEETMPRAAAGANWPSPQLHCSLAIFWASPSWEPSRNPAGLNQLSVYAWGIHPQIEMLESSQDRGRFSDVRESTRELPTPLSLPSSSSSPAASWAALAGPSCRPHGHIGFWLAHTAPTTAAPWDREKDPGSGRGAAGAGRERGRL